MKALVSVEGSKRLKEWCREEKIKILNCGKVISPQLIHLDKQLDLLLERGKKNGANVEIIDQKEFKKLVPQGRTSSGRALWSPDTSVVNPKEILKRLEKCLIDSGVYFIKGCLIKEVIPEIKKIKFLRKKSKAEDLDSINYGYLFNTSGVNADLIAKKFRVGINYSLLPFKGIYWRLDPNSKIKFNTN